MGYLNSYDCLKRKNGQLGLYYQGRWLDIYAAFHTHPNSLEETIPSPGDIRNQNQYGVPYYIIGYKDVVKLENGVPRSIGSRDDITNCRSSQDFYAR